LAIGQAGVSAVGSIATHQSAKSAAAQANRAKLLNYNRDVDNWQFNEMINRTIFSNEALENDRIQDNLYTDMLDTWMDLDFEHSKLEGETSQGIEEAIRKMYQNDYAGTQTGRTAARIAGKSAKALGFAKVGLLRELMFSKKETQLQKDQALEKQKQDSIKSWTELGRFTPIPERAPSKAAMEAGLDHGPSGLALGANLLNTGLGLAPDLFPKTFGGE
tara:strand:+ start:8123 stop:8776 length:654 start_codon:yes stop_codon:yes gene_type:complete